MSDPAAGGVTSPSVAVSAAAVGLVASGALAAGVVLAELAARWFTDPYYAHAALVPLLSAYAAWTTRHALGVPVPRLGAAVLLLAAAVALVATGPLLPLCARAAALPILGAAAVLATLGWRALRALTFPIAFLLFLIPPPATGLAQVSGSLQTLAAFGTEHLLHGLSIPVTRVGLELRIGRDVLEITEACNGLRFLLTMIVVGVAFAWAAARTRGGGLVIVAAMALTAIAANVARVSVTAILTHLVGVQAATGPAHLVYGKLVYAVFGAALFLAVWRRAVRRG